MNEIKGVDEGNRAGRLGEISMRKAKNVEGDLKDLKKLKATRVVVSFEILKRAGAACRADKKGPGD